MSKLSKTIIILINILTILAVAVTIVSLVYHRFVSPTTYLSEASYYIVPLAIIDSLYFLIVKLIRKRREKRNFNLTN